MNTQEELTEERATNATTMDSIREIVTAKKKNRKWITPFEQLMWEIAVANHFGTKTNSLANAGWQKISSDSPWDEVATNHTAIIAILNKGDSTGGRIIQTKGLYEILAKKSQISIWGMMKKVFEPTFTIKHGAWDRIPMYDKVNKLEKSLNEVFDISPDEVLDKVKSYHLLHTGIHDNLSNGIVRSFTRKSEMVSLKEQLTNRNCSYTRIFVEYRE